MAFRRRGNRTKPLLDIHCQWNTWNQYPDVVTILMRNGHAVRYVIDSKPIRIHTGPDGWERGKQDVVGYQYGKKNGPRMRRFGSRR